MKMKLAAELKKMLGMGPHTEKVLVLDGDDPVGYRVVKRLVDAEFTNLRVGTTKFIERDDITKGFVLVPFVFGDEETYTAAL